MEGKTTQHKKTQVAPKHDGRPSLQEAVPMPFVARSRRQGFAALRAQLEKEGIFSRSGTGRLEEHTRFPMFRN
jgi:hypothetical protein